MSKIMIQTDNGSEYIGCVGRKRGKTAFEKVLDKFEAEHIRIPPGAKTYQADVEAFHRLVEDELYKTIEDYDNKEQFLAKAYAYQLYFDFRRKKDKGGKNTCRYTHRMQESNFPSSIQFTSNYPG